MVEPVLIEPEAPYDDAALRQALGLTDNSLANARRAGTLRYTRQGKRTLYKGAWILDWLESAATKPPAPHPVAARPEEAAHA